MPGGMCPMTQPQQPFLHEGKTHWECPMGFNCDTCGNFTGCTSIPPCTRSRPAPPPKTWESCMEHVTCPNGEECWYLSEDFHNEEKAAIAVKARNQTLNDVRAALSHIRFQDEDAWFIEATIKKIESLRTEAPIPQHNRGEQR